MRRLRVGELCALKWFDVEQNGKSQHIHVQREVSWSISEENKKDELIVLDHCKSPSGERKLLLNSTCRDLLVKIREMNIKNGFPVTDDDFIFLRYVKGQAVLCTDRCFSSRLEKYERRVGMTVLKSPHDIRRTALTNLFYAGMPLKSIQEYAGHATLQQTMDYIRIHEDGDIMQYLEVLSNPPKRNVIPFPVKNEMARDGTNYFGK